MYYNKFDGYNDNSEIHYLDQIYGQILDFKNDNDYVVNQLQLDKLIYTIDFMLELAETCSAEDDPVSKVVLIPKEICGSVTARFKVFDLCDLECQKFADILSWASALGVVPDSEDNLDMTITIPDIFEHK